MHIIIYHRYNPTWPPCCRHFAHHRSSIIQMAERSYPRMTIWSPSDRLDRSVKAPSQSIHRFTHNLQERTGLFIYFPLQIFANICKLHSYNVFSWCHAIMFSIFNFGRPSTTGMEPCRICQRKSSKAEVIKDKSKAKINMPPGALIGGWRIIPVDVTG